jgi:HrpA-like RNA helicase
MLIVGIGKKEYLDTIIGKKHNIKSKNNFNEKIYNQDMQNKYPDEFLKITKMITDVYPPDIYEINKLYNSNNKCKDVIDNYYNILLDILDENSNDTEINKKEIIKIIEKYPLFEFNKFTDDKTNKYYIKGDPWGEWKENHYMDNNTIYEDNKDKYVSFKKVGGNEFYHLKNNINVVYTTVFTYYFILKSLSTIWDQQINSISNDLNKINKGNIFIIRSGTGTGKSTQLPPLFLEETYNYADKTPPKQIICTQPRVANAKSLAVYVPTELGIFNKNNNIIASHAGSENESTKDTQIVYMTEDTLIHILKGSTAESFGTKYSAIIIDEVHERNLSTDFLMMHLKGFLNDKKVVPFKLIITSATINIVDYINYFELNINNNSFDIPGAGEQFSKTVISLDNKGINPDDPNIIQSLNITKSEDYIHDGILLCKKIHSESDYKDDKGSDILFFMPKIAEMSIVESALNQYDPDGIIVYKMHSAAFKKLSIDEIKVILSEKAPIGKRKIILTTDISETGVTYKTVKYVIDSGITNAVTYNPILGATIAKLVHVNSNSLEQRLGRIGRVANGYYYPLYNWETYQSIYGEEEDRFKDTIPKILSTDFTDKMLDLMYLKYNKGIKNTNGKLNEGHRSIDITDRKEFDFMTKPSPELISTAVHKLYSLGAVDENCLLTDLGILMGALTMRSEYRHMIIASIHYRCTHDIITIISMIETGDILENDFFNIYDLIITEKNRVNKKISYNDRNDNESKIIKKNGIFDITEYHSDHLLLLYMYKRWKENDSSETWCKKYGINHKTLLKIELRIIKNLKQLNDTHVPIFVDYNKSIPQHYSDIVNCLKSGYSYNTAYYDSDINNKDPIFKKYYIKSGSTKIPVTLRSSFFKNMPGKDLIKYNNIPGNIIFDSLSVSNNKNTGVQEYIVSMITNI